MNKTNLKFFIFMSVLFLSFFMACKSKETSNTEDATPPSTDNTEIEAYQVTDNEISLRWKRSVDNVTLSNDVVYSIYISTDSSLDTLEGVHSNGERLHQLSLASILGNDLGEFDYSNRITLNTVTHSKASKILPKNNISEGKHTYLTAKISGLDRDTAYYLNIMVEDEGKNQSLYQSIQQRTKYYGVALTFTPDGGIYSSDQMVTISAEPESGSTKYVHQTTVPIDIDTLSKSDFVQYSSDIPVLGDKKQVTIYAYGTHPIYPDSEIISATFGIDYKMPRFSSPEGTYTSVQNITLTTTVNGATIYYTTDGSSPNTDKMLYTDPIYLSGEVNPVTIKAITIKEGITPSAVAEAKYVLLLDQVLIPEITNPPTKGNSQYIPDNPYLEISTTTGAIIYYTLDGTVPDESSTVFTPSTIMLDSTTDWNITARAYKSGMYKSEISTGQYHMMTAQPRINIPGDCVYGYSWWTGGYYNCPTSFDVSMDSPDPTATIYYTWGTACWNAPSNSDSTYDGETFTLTDPDLEGNCIVAISYTEKLGYSYWSNFGKIYYP